MNVPPSRIFEVLRFSWDQLDRATDPRPRLTGEVSAVALDPERLEASLEALFPGTLSAGTLRVNGREVPFSPEAAPREALDAIEASVPDVAAALHATTGRVRLAPRLAGGRLSLDGGGTGFFAALGIAEGTWVSVTEPARAVARAARSLEQLSGLLEGLLAHEDAQRILGEVPETGVRGGRPPEPAIVVERLRLQARLRNDPAALRRWVVGTEDEFGPLEALAAHLGEVLPEDA